MRKMRKKTREKNTKVGGVLESFVATWENK
jgi:hypothetical protein